MAIKIVTFQTRAEVSLDSDVAYIYVQPHRADEKGVVEISQAIGNLVLDFDKDGKLFGIEFLSASKELPQFIFETHCRKSEE